MKPLFRVTALLLVLALCLTPVRAAESESQTEYLTEWSSGLDSIMAEFMEAHGLNESNFSMGYLYTGTGEYWYYNEDFPIIGGSLYKVPLNMAIQEKIMEGTLSDSDIVGGMSLYSAQYQSIVLSRNPISDDLRRYLTSYAYGYYSAFREEILKYSGTYLEDVPADYYEADTFTSEFILNTLIYLYDNAEDFERIIDFMKLAMEDHYFKLYVDDYEIAHKYGLYGGALNDMAIVYTPTPFLLVVMTKGLGFPESLLGEICSLAVDYTLELDAKYERERQLQNRLNAAERADANEQRREQDTLSSLSDSELALLEKTILDTVTATATESSFSSLLLSML